MTPRSRKSGYGLLLECRSPLDAGPFLKILIFFTMFGKWIGQKPGNYSPSVLVRHRNRSGVVDSVGSKPLMFAKVENGVTKSCQTFRRKNRKNAILAWFFPHFLSRIACCSQESTTTWQNLRQKQQKKKKKKLGLKLFFKSGCAHPVFSGELSFFWPRKN